MKIQGPGKTDAAGKAGKSKKTPSDGESFKSMLSSGSTQDAGGAGTVGLSGGITAIDSLLAAQAAEDPTERATRGRMVKRANDLLDKLEELKMRLLSGTMTLGQMLDLGNVVSAHRERISDPELTALLDEIDLRAQIELAKLEMAKSKLR